MTTSFRGLYDIRSGKETDKNFVMATFLRGLYYGDSWFSTIPKSIFMDNYKKIVEHLVNNGILIVACLKDEPDVIIGYSLLSQDLKTVHWVYVKNSKLEEGVTWRGKGIARSLLPKEVTYVSHLSALGKKLLSKFPTASFNPFSLN